MILERGDIFAYKVLNDTVLMRRKLDTEIRFELVKIKTIAPQSKKDSFVGKFLRSDFLR